MSIDLAQLRQARRFVGATDSVAVYRAAEAVLDAPLIWWCGSSFAMHKPPNCNDPAHGWVALVSVKPPQGDHS